MLKYFNSQALGWGMSRDFVENRPVIGFFHSIFSSRRQNLDDASTGKPAEQMG
jgi:hypothetical protein